VANVTAEQEIRRLLRIIRRTESNLCRAATFVYKSNDLKSLNRALEKMAHRVGRVIDTLREEIP
jgi:hypothetical protein